ncbi:MAG: 50S ribosomal protein L17 [Saprospiraceae bacterium]
MRHGKKVNHLGRTASHRNALLRNLANALIKYKRINTTVAKAKALRGFIEPLITKSRSNTTHSRRVVFSYLQNKESVKELFDAIAEKVGDRPGGYVRILKTGFRKGDAADMAMIELVDYNEIYTAGKEAGKEDGRKKRSRRGGSGKSAATAAVAAPAAVAAVEEAIVEAEEVLEEADDVVAETEAAVEEAEANEAAETEEPKKDGEA